MMEKIDYGKCIYDIVVSEVDAIYPQFMKRVNDIDIVYFEDITHDTELLPMELNFELRDKVVEDIRQYAMKLLEKSNIKRRIKAILKDTDVANANQAIEDSKAKLRSYINVSSFLNGSSFFTEVELQKLYEAANKRNLWERITQTNKNDVVEFYHALMNKTYEQSKDILYGCIESFMNDEI